MHVTDLESPENPADMAVIVSLDRGGDQGRRSRISQRALAALWRVVILASVIAVWELLAAEHWVSSLLLPGPWPTAVAVERALTQAGTLQAVAESGRQILFAFIYGAGAGLVIGLILAGSALLRKAYLGIILLILSTPKVIFLPAFLLLFGLSPNLAIVYGAFEASVYVVVNVVGGFDLVEDHHLRVARAFNASVAQRLAVVVVPGAAPGIFAGLWYGARHAFTGVLLAELWASSTGGVGALVNEDIQTLQIADALAIVFIVSVIIVVVGTGWTALEMRMTRWRGDLAYDSMRGLQG